MQKSPSTRSLSALPEPDELERLCKSLATLDAILSPEWDQRYYSFNCKWDVDTKLASMRDGSGDSFVVLFGPVGVIIKGDAHESIFAKYSVDMRTPWPGVVDTVPKDFDDFLSEPAFSANEATFCVWRKRPDATWKIGNVQFPPGDDPDGSADLLRILDGNPKTYKTWSEEYYDRTVPVGLIKYIYEHKPLTTSFISKLNPNTNAEGLSKDIKEIGYPRLM